MRFARKADAPSSIPNIAIMVVGIMHKRHSSTLSSMFDNLIPAIQRLAKPHVYLCISSTFPLPIEHVSNVSVSIISQEVEPSGFHDQFQRSAYCYNEAQREARERGIVYGWFIKTRPDLLHMPSSQLELMDIPNQCVHAKFREVQNLEQVDGRMLSLPNCHGECPGNDLETHGRVCFDVDDQFAMVPAHLAGRFFDFGNQPIRRMFKSLGECRGKSGPENRLTQWPLHSSIPVCPIGHPSSAAFTLQFILPKWDAKCSSWEPLRCGASPLPYEEFMANIMSQSVETCSNSPEFLQSVEDDTC